MKSFRSGAVGLGVGAALLLCTACGAASTTPAASSRSTSGRPQLNPAMQAAFDVIRLEPVVPFSSAQVKQLVPLFQGLVKDPSASATQLATDAKQIEAVFTSTQQEALKNMAAAGAGAGAGTGAGGGAGGFGGFAGRRSSAGAAGPGGTAGGARFSRSGSFSGRGAGGPGFSAAAIYQRAISTLQGGGSSSASSSTQGAPTATA